MRRLRQAHVSDVNAPTSPAAYSLGVASGVEAPLSACSNIPDRGAQAGAAMQRLLILLHSADVQRLGVASGVASGVDAPL